MNTSNNYDQGSLNVLSSNDCIIKHLILSTNLEVDEVKLVQMYLIFSHF